MTAPAPLPPPAARCDRGRFWALLPCAGKGLRAAGSAIGEALPKQYQPLAGRAMVLHTLAAFARVRRLQGTLVAVAPGDRFLAAHAHADAAFVAVECGGATRAATVLGGLRALLARGAQRSDWVLVHDAARCLVSSAQIDALIDLCAGDRVGGLLALPLADTLKCASASASGGGAAQAARARATLVRGDKWLAQTPQMFRIGPLLQALARADPGVTDEAAAMEALGLQPRLVPGAVQNFKLTYPEDFALAEAVLAQRAAGLGASGGGCSACGAGCGASGAGRPANHAPTAVAARQHEPGSMTQDQSMHLRIGEGWDIHALVPGRALRLGGVEIAHGMGLLGHSDGDALLHAITDALLGAAALGDIGSHFPDSDEAHAGADSAALLAQAAARVRAAGHAIVNVDSTVIAQAPRLAAHIPAMRQAIARALGVAHGQVNVKAKTAECLGPVGQGLAIEARAVALIFRL